MKLNREQIIKALDLHSQAEKPCLRECPYGNLHYCGAQMAKDALALVRELTEENERVRVVADMSDTAWTDALRIVNKFCDSRIKRARADTVREIFADLEMKAPWFCENQTAYEHFNEELAELKKKYTEGLPDDDT